MKTYILLNDHSVQIEPDLKKWGKWMESADRHVAKTDLGEVWISTVFLGIDHGFGEKLPVLFETMIFGGVRDQEQWRYTTWDEAVAGHEKAVRLVKPRHLKVVK